MGDAGPGHRPRHRPAARPDPTRHDRRLRRQPHQHARRVRGAGVRHRHQRGRARPRHPVAAAAATARPWRSRSTARCPTASPRRTWSSGSSRQIGTGGGQGHVIEYRGEAIRGLSMEGRMTVCNMSIEAGARAGMIAPDETTFDYLKGRPNAPQGRRLGRRGRRTGAASSPTTTRPSTRSSASTRRRSRRGSRGEPTPGRARALSGSVPAAA